MGSLSQVHQQPDPSYDIALNALLNEQYRAVVCEYVYLIFTHKGMIGSRCVDVATGRAL